jgi:hypothetical protein
MCATAREKNCVRSAECMKELKTGWQLTPIDSTIVVQYSTYIRSSVLLLFTLNHVFVRGVCRWVLTNTVYPGYKKMPSARIFFYYSRFFL